MTDPLAEFSRPTRAWFTGTFEEPTPAQAGAWAAITQGRHALVVAPTGSGKTLAAFLWAVDRLAGEPLPEDPGARCRVVYVSPLKALAADVERNLRSPLVGIGQAALHLGLPAPQITVGTRTGDTPPGERRAFATRPPDILITTPESLFLILTSQARAGLRGVTTVIIDEIHAVAGTKRGAHLAVSLERLDALVEGEQGPAQRIGLSATVRPVDRVAGFLAGARDAGSGGREVVVVQPPSTKEVRVDVVVPVPDLTDLAGATDPTGAATSGPDLTGSAAAGPRRASIWPHVEERVVDLVTSHHSTLVFANSRRGAERLTARLNEVWAEREGYGTVDHGAAHPAQAPGQSGTAAALDTRAAVLARAHHGSMSRGERTRTESELKAGTLPAVVATSSLELGIDMGAVDLVVQVGAPPSVASGLQRIGRAGHQVGAVSRGVLFPTFRGELVPAAVVAGRMRAGEIEHLTVLTSPLDVLAQQIVAMVALDDWPVDDLARVLRRAAPFAQLGESTLHAVLDMLAGRYPSEDFAELRPRLVWDRHTQVLSGRPGALRLAVTSGGTIPDRGLYGVFLAAGARPGAEAGGAAERGGRRVGELDEEMVYESRVGDTFTLGSSTWRIEEITTDQVLVSPAPGMPGRLPFWKGDSPGRPAELGREIGRWVRETRAEGSRGPQDAALRAGLDAWAAENLGAYLAAQEDSTGAVPDDRTIVVERFRDEVGDWRVVVHSPYGARVHAPWALVIAARLRERHGLDAAALHSDDGIVLRLPDTLSAGHWDPAAGTWVEPEGAGRVDLEDLLIDPDEVLDTVRSELGGSAMFAARFREAAARALLLPRRRPDRRQPLWQQRQRSAQLLEVASRFPDFPILLEAARECLRDDFDVAALAELMRQVSSGAVRVVEVATPTPSPFAQSLLVGYTAQFLYDGDAPLAERRAAALSLDTGLLAELLGDAGAAPLADLLDPQAVEQVEAELAGMTPQRLARDREAVVDVVRRHGPLSTAAVEQRTAAPVRDEVAGWLAALRTERRLLEVRLAGVADGPRWAVVEDAGRLRDALGVALPPGVPEDLAAPVPDPLGDLVHRYARTHGPFHATQVAAHLGLPTAPVVEVLARLEARGTLVHGGLRPDSLGGTGDEYCDAAVLRLLRRRSLAALRAEVEPVDQEDLALFLPTWQGIRGDAGARATGPQGQARGSRSAVDTLLRVVDQIAGAVIPASALETLILPARVPDYSPAMLDELTATGEVLWAGHAPIAARDGLVSLHPAATADLTLPAPSRDNAPATELHAAIRGALAGGGAYFLGPLAQRVADELGQDPGEEAVTAALWDLVWATEVTNDGLAPLRARIGARGARARGTTHATRAAPPRPRRLRGIGLRPVGPPTTPPTGAGRWSALPPVEVDPTLRAHAAAAVLLDRHGVVTRAVAPAEGVSGQFTAIYRVLSALEEQGRVRRGYFVEHLGGSQFALPGAVDELRSLAATRSDTEVRTTEPDRAAAGDATADRPRVVVLAATDPANPYGAALPWPRSTGRHRPGRKAGAVVVMVEGSLVLYLERGARSLLSFTTKGVGPATDALCAAARTGALGRITVHRVDGAEVLDRETLATPTVTGLLAAGSTTTPRGLRLPGPM